LRNVIPGDSFSVERIMPDNEPNRPRSKRWGVIAALPVLYVLSVGPVSLAFEFAFRHFPDREDSLVASADAIGVLYAPLDWAAERAKWFEDVLEWWMELPL
jgi:hypothetical protein